MKIGDQHKLGAPHVVRGTSRFNLEGWVRGERPSMPFAITRIWREPQNHVKDRYF